MSSSRIAWRMYGVAGFLLANFLAYTFLAYTAVAQPPEFDLDSLKPPEVDFGASEEGQAAQKTTAEQPDFVPVTQLEEPTQSEAWKLIVLLTVFVLSTFVGFEVVSKVPPPEYMALISGLTAISGITLIGALYVGGRTYPILSIGLSVLAVVFAAMNVVGGFCLTHRLLTKFRREP